MSENVNNGANNRGNGNARGQNLQQVLADSIGDFRRTAGVLQRLQDYLPKHTDYYKTTYESVRDAVNKQTDFLGRVNDSVVRLKDKFDAIGNKLDSVDGRHAQSLTRYDHSLQQELQKLFAESRRYKESVALVYKAGVVLLAVIVVVVGVFEYFRYTEITALHLKIDELVQYQRTSAATSSSVPVEEKKYPPGVMKARPDQRKAAKSDNQ